MGSRNSLTQVAVTETTHGERAERIDPFGRPHTVFTEAYTNVPIQPEVEAPTSTTSYDLIGITLTGKRAHWQPLLGCPRLIPIRGTLMIPTKHAAEAATPAGSVNELYETLISLLRRKREDPENEQLRIEIDKVRDRLNKTRNEQLQKMDALFTKQLETAREEGQRILDAVRRFLPDQC